MCEVTLVSVDQEVTRQSGVVSAPPLEPELGGDAGFRLASLAPSVRPPPRLTSSPFQPWIGSERCLPLPLFCRSGQEDCETGKSVVYPF